MKALETGLRQIPKHFLRDNLLPKLKDKNSKLLFTGSVASLEEY